MVMYDEMWHINMIYMWLSMILGVIVFLSYREISRMFKEAK